MKLVSTLIFSTRVQMRFADDEDESKSTEWVEFSVRVAHKEDPFLSELQLEALERARDTLGPEIQRLKALAGHRLK
jgi:hypothetical protein